MLNEEKIIEDERDDIDDKIDLTNTEDKETGRFDPSSDEDEYEKKQKVNDVINSSFGQRFTEDELIHLAPAGLKTGFYIDPKSIDKNGRYRYMFCMDMNSYDEVQMIQSIRNLMESELMTNPKDGSKREAQFYDFGAHVLRISRDQFEDIVTDPDKCRAWAASLGRTIDEIKNGFDGAVNEKSTYKEEKYPEIKQVSPDAELESDLSANKSLDDVIKGDGYGETDEPAKYSSVEGGL